MCVCVCVCVCEREREREREWGCISVNFSNIFHRKEDNLLTIVKKISNPLQRGFYDVKPPKYTSELEKFKTQNFSLLVSI